MPSASATCFLTSLVRSEEANRDRLSKNICRQEGITHFRWLRSQVRRSDRIRNLLVANQKRLTHWTAATLSSMISSRVAIPRTGIRLLASAR